jgi:hypothetical protein
MSHRVHRAIRLSSTTAAGLCLTALMASGASGQVAYTSFVPAGSYGSNETAIFSVGSSSNWFAASFGYIGSPVNLSSIRIAAQDWGDPQPLKITFLDAGVTGPSNSMSTAVALESWTLPGTGSPSADQIYTLTSLLDPALVSGHTYWVELSTGPYPPNSYYWGWNDANAGVFGNWENSANNGATWSATCSNNCGARAYDVNVTSVTPEPATMSLMALGLVGLAGLRRRKRSR